MLPVATEEAPARTAPFGFVAKLLFFLLGMETADDFFLAGESLELAPLDESLELVAPPPTEETYPALLLEEATEPNDKKNWWSTNNYE